MHHGIVLSGHALMHPCCPAGYGLNSGASEGLPAPALPSMVGGHAFPPDQYTAVGFTHYQASGTGSIGNYMNYIKVGTPN